MKGLAVFLTIASLSLTVYGQSRTPRFDIDVGRHKYLTDFGEKVKDACTRWYARVARYLSTPGYTDPNAILIRFDPNYDGVAYAEWDKNRITGATKYYREQGKDDVGSMIHEMAHIIQKYPGDCPCWYVEGLADYVRYFQFEPRRAPGKPRSNRSYREGYGTAAYFLNHLTEKVKGGKDAVLAAHKGCREGSYKDSVWREFTGRNLDSLWEDMQKNF